MSRAASTVGHDRPRTARELGIMQGFPPPPEKRPTLENWDLPPFNRWSFQNIRSLFPTVGINRGDGPVFDLPQALRPFDDFRFEAPEGGEKTVAQCLSDTYTDAFLVLHKGKVLTGSYFNDMSPATPHLSQSVAKSVVGALIGILHADGVLDLGAPLGDLVPELKRCGYKDATLNHVLDMQSGVRFTEDYGIPGSDMTRIDIASGWRPARKGEIRPTIRDVILTLPKVRDHGVIFEYRSIETDVAAWVAERVTGASLAQLISDRIWSRIGAETEAFFTVDAAGTALADGGFNATLRDYARFALMMAEGGKVGDRQVVPETWVESLRRGEADKFGAPYTDLSPNGAYRRHWWIRDLGRGDFMARGVFGQLLYIDPDNRFVAVKLSTWPDYLIPTFGQYEMRMIEAIRDSL
ncbi:serine hydrolase domain-containing protein [Hwanghaeella sp.]|uniref:serine hydrolase domain-containing protein n=1 Tax=Hwanghaeella sp. TaxID=2605943 RepID=UPI003CCB96EB